MSTGTASNFFNPSAGIDEVPPIKRGVFKNPLPPGVDQLAASKSETALMQGRALDAVNAPGAKTRSKVNAPPEMARSAPAPTLDPWIKRGQLGAAKGQAADLGDAMSTFKR